jgi:16S rRNA processing protein RimM
MQLVVGRIGRAHGVRGDLFVEVRTDEPDERFVQGATLITSNGQSLTVATSKWHSGRLVVHFVDYDDRTTAETLRGLELSVDVDPLVLPTEEDEYYDHQLMGLRVQHESGELVGVISDVIHLPSQDMFAVTREDDTEVLIPFVREFVPDVDVAGGVVTITPPPGLLDELEAIVVREVESDDDDEEGADEDGHDNA